MRSPYSVSRVDKQCHGVLLQFHDFIVSNLDLPSFEKLLPPFERIVKEYGIEPSVAFYLWRPILAEKIRQYDVDLSIQVQKKKLLQGLAANEKPGDNPEDPAESSPTADEAMQDVSRTAPPSATTDDAVGLTEEQNGISPAPEPDEYSPYPSSYMDISINERPWHPALRDFIEEAGHVVASEAWIYMRYRH
jgi:THO complex subunit 2